MKFVLVVVMDMVIARKVAMGFVTVNVNLDLKEINVNSKMMIQHVVVHYIKVRVIEDHMEGVNVNATTVGMGIDVVIDITMIGMIVFAIQNMVLVKEVAMENVLVNAKMNGMDHVVMKNITIIIMITTMIVFVTRNMVPVKEMSGIDVLVSVKREEVVIVAKMIFQQLVIVL